jgi:hypothetical protein
MLTLESQSRDTLSDLLLVIAQYRSLPRDNGMCGGEMIKQSLMKKRGIYLLTGSPTVTTP